MSPSTKASIRALNTCERGTVISARHQLEVNLATKNHVLRFCLLELKNLCPEYVCWYSFTLAPCAAVDKTRVKVARFCMLCGSVRGVIQGL